MINHFSRKKRENETDEISETSEKPPSFSFVSLISSVSFSLFKADHGRRRILRAGLTGVTTLAAKSLTVGLSLLTLPLTSHYLGKERFGVWLTLSSFITWFAVADFGLNVSLLNALSNADGKDDRRQAREAVTGAFYVMSAIACAIILICLFTLPLVNLAGMFNLESPQAILEIEPAVVVVLVFCALRLPASIINSIFMAYQEGFIYQICHGVSGLLGILGLVLAIYLKSGLPWLTAAFLGSMLLADLLSSIYLFGWRRRWLLPTPGYFKWSQIKWLLTRGGQFWIAHLSILLILQTDLMIVTWMFGASEVAAYGATLRLFTLIGAAQAAFTFPLWAAYGEASTRKDYVWLGRTFKQSIRISLMWSIPSACALFIAIPLLFKWLVTPDVIPNWRLSLAIMITEIINSIARCISSFLNGLGAVRLQAIVGPVGGAANLCLSWALGSMLGPPGVAWATCICLLIFWVGVMGKDSIKRMQTMSAV